MRFVLRALAVPILGCLVATCQEAGPQRQPRLSGVVVASDTGQPLTKARVYLPRERDGEARAATTAADGAFSFDQVVPGSYDLMAERNGYADSFETHGRSRLTLTVTAGPDMPGLRLQLVRSATITGKVVDDDGEPVPHASVEVLRRRYVRGAPEFIAVRSDSTNDLGEYRIFGLPPGRYILRVAQEQRWGRISVRMKGAAETVFPPIYYPETPVRDAAVPYEVGPGAEGRADFHLVGVAGVTIRGRVIGLEKSDQPFRASVMLRSGQDPQVGGAVVQEDGTFEIRGVAPGTYSLDASTPQMGTGSGEQKPLTAHRKLVITSAPTDELVLQRQPVVSGEIGGQIRVDGSAPKLDRLYVSLATVGNDDDDFPMYGRNGGYAVVKPDGSFKMEVRGRGKFRALLAARGPGLEDYYTKAVLYGGRDVTDSGFTFSGGTGAIELIVSSAGARIEGSVFNDSEKPVQGATVIAVPEKTLRDRYDLYGRAHSDQMGHFVIRGQRPGSYTLLALDDAGEGIYMDPEFLKVNEDKGQSLHAEANGRHQLSLKVISVQQTD